MREVPLSPRPTDEGAADWRPCPPADAAPPTTRPTTAPRDLDPARRRSVRVRPAGPRAAQGRRRQPADVLLPARGGVHLRPRPALPVGGRAGTGRRRAVARAAGGTHDLRGLPARDRRHHRAALPRGPAGRGDDLRRPLRRARVRAAARAGDRGRTGRRGDGLHPRRDAGARRAPGAPRLRASPPPDLRQRSHRGRDRGAGRPVARGQRRRHDADRLPPRAAAADDVPGHHPPRRPRAGPRARAAARGRRDRVLPDGEALHHRVRLGGVGAAVGRARPGRRRPAALLHRSDPGHHRAPAAAHGVAGPHRDARARPADPDDGDHRLPRPRAVLLGRAGRRSSSTTCCSACPRPPAPCRPCWRTR